MNTSTDLDAYLLHIVNTNTAFEGSLLAKSITNYIFEISYAVKISPSITDLCAHCSAYLASLPYRLAQRPLENFMIARIFATSLR
jgi:hypothetical protein